MRRKAPLIVGAGPAGCLAAIALCRGGAEPRLLDRDEKVGDALCGGFLSWRTAQSLRGAGVEPEALGAHPVESLALIAGDFEATAALPSSGFGLSRRALDSALRRRAVGEGARLIVDRVRSVQPDIVEGEEDDYAAEAIFLASGKHDVRGQARPREGDDPALGLRIRIPAHDALHALLSGRIELHLFRGGYAGIVLQEDGSANVCLALRKSLLAGASGQPPALLDRLAATYPAFGERMAFAPPGLTFDTVGSVPYGFIAETTDPGLYRIGDQAAVIPSLAGEGMGIAMDSGNAAARAWLAGRSAPWFQADFAVRAERPVRVAQLIWRIAEAEAGARLLTAATRAVPSLARAAMALTRI
ncbi:FAD-dependent monooxygenase [Tsuneonella sp. YG55]|uniref:FAD-dependent monooxygenase n=1 Tax=Tsuneonella litorea TaxID=2976475 RepID=A0A9X3AKV5_9SPHN|nr:FAD-dependent monooxygenase [Tsuneonella litorea]MCT2558408.1 FAD-dependent monooxygenase [Tsuneonella litorea]